MKRIAELFAALALGATGGVLATPLPAAPTPVVEVRSDAVQMDPRDPAYKPLMRQLQESGAAEVECRSGVISNAPGRTYCWGGTAGFLVTRQTLEDLAGAIEAAFPGLVATAAYLQLKDGRLWLSASGER